MERPEGKLARAVAAWAAHDLNHALCPADEAVIRATEPLRWLVVDLFSARASARDLFSACARLGALMAEQGGSPSLASSSIDGAVVALSELGLSFDGSRVAPARASLFEGYVAAVQDAERSAGMARWEYPACAVPLAEGAVAIACGYPSDDLEALAGWAGRVASQLVKAEVRRVVLSGPDVVKAEVAAAAALVGIEVGETASPHDRKKGWLRLPWRR